MKNGYTERLVEAFRLRMAGLTYKAIGERMGISPARVRQLCDKAVRMFTIRFGAPIHWTHGLSTRTSNAIIWRFGLKSRYEVMQAYTNGTLKPKGYPLIRGYGYASHKELGRWLGLLPNETAPNKKPCE